MLASISWQPVQRWTLGPLSVSPHGVGTAGGFLLGVYLMSRAAERRGIARSEVHNATTWGAIGAVIGARGFYVLAHLDDFRSITEILAVWRGGLTMFGGFALGIAAGIWYMRRRGLDVPVTMDAAAPGFVAGVMCGRIGDLIIGDHLGEPTSFALGYRIPSGADLAPGYGPPTYVPGSVVHTTALYDLLGLIVLAFVLSRLAKREPASGTLFSVFGVWYGVQRFVIDFTRNRELIESNFFGLSGSQWAGLLFAAIGAYALRRIGRRVEEPVAGAVAAKPEVADAGVAGAGVAEPESAEPEGSEPDGAEPDGIAPSAHIEPLPQPNADEPATEERAQPAAGDTVSSEERPEGATAPPPEDADGAPAARADRSPPAPGDEPEPSSAVEDPPRDTAG